LSQSLTKLGGEGETKQTSGEKKFTTRFLKIGKKGLQKRNGIHRGKKKNEWCLKKVKKKRRKGGGGENRGSHIEVSREKKKRRRGKKKKL